MTEAEAIESVGIGRETKAILKRRQVPLSAVCQIGLMDTVYEGIARELERRRRSERASDQSASSWKWLAGRLNVSQQVVSNWKQAGVPASRYADIAAVLGWSMERLVLGGAEEAPQPRLSPYALEIAVRMDALQEEDLRLFRAAYMQLSDVLDRLALPAARPSSESAPASKPEPSRRR